MYHTYTSNDFDQLSKFLSKALKDLFIIDGTLFSMFDGKTDTAPEERKLHEVCINHRFAVHLEKLAPSFGLNDYFVDIEYNRNMHEQKQARLHEDGDYRTVRPDILIHKRTNKSSPLSHYLVIEAKKNESSEDDIDKINRLLKDSDFKYKFGLTIQYLSDQQYFVGNIYYYENGQVEPRKFRAPKS